MTITDSPVTEVSELEAQLLFEEARRRRHRRWLIGTVLVVALALAAALLLSFDSGTPRSRPQPRMGSPRWTPPQGSPHDAPALFVAGDGNGGVGVYSTVTGSLIRSISPQGPGGPDQQIVLSDNRQSVYFVQPTGPCSGNILSGPVSGSSSPAVVVSRPNTLALSPSASPTSKELAWVGVTCGSTGSTNSSTLSITHLATGVTNDLGVFSGQQSDEGISWNSDGTRLAVESGATVAIFDTEQSTPSKVSSLVVTRGCTLASPTFLSPPNKLAAIRTCFDKSGALGTSQALVFNIKNSKPVAIVASAPHGSTFQGLSVDESGQHILLGVATRSPASAENVQVEGAGRLVTVSHRAPTDAQW
jgi:hypothetical protein